MIIAAAQQDYAAALPGGGAADADATFFEILEYFRDTNAEGLRIRKRLEDAIAVGPSSEPAGVLRAFFDAAAIIHNEITDARERAAEVDRWRRLDAKSVARYARELTQVSDAWDDLEQFWSPYWTGHDSGNDSGSNPNDVSATDLIRIGRGSIDVLNRLVFTCACQTIPNELDAYLSNYRIGTCLDFVATFRDQLPSDDATRAVLAWLAPQSVVISGLVDLKHGQVIKADHRAGRQLLSVGYVAAAVLVGFGLIALSSHAGGWLGFPANAWPVQGGERHSLSSAYVLVLIGVLAHWILDRVKLNRSGDDVTPFSEWLMWIHVNEVSIVTRIATVWLTIALGLGLGAYKLTPQIQPVTWFTAGYFLDSTFDALLGRFNTFISSKDPGKQKEKA